MMRIDTVMKMYDVMVMGTHTGVVGNLSFLILQKESVKVNVVNQHTPLFLHKNVRPTY